MSADIVIAPLHHSRSYVFADEGITKEIGEYFSYEVPGARFMHAVKRRHWDGRIRVYHKPTQTLPTGLIPRLEVFAASRGYSVRNTLTTTRSEWSEFDTECLIAKYPVPFEIRSYQREAITYALHHQRCALLSPTASGKSLILYYLVRHLMEAGPVLLIVPTISLVSQLTEDFREYGWTDVDMAVHQITGGVEKQTNKPCVISTWQSVFRQSEAFFARFHTLLGDEAHLFKSTSLQSIMEKLPQCAVRIGVTGTLDDAKSHLLLVEGSFGPAHRVARTADLQTRGHLTPIMVQAHFLQYGTRDKWMLKEQKRSYHEELDYLVQHSGRMSWLVDFVSQLTGNVLVLYTYVEKHGIPLYEAIRQTLGATRPIYFVSGDIDGPARERVRALLESAEHCVLDFGDLQVRCTPEEMVPLSNGRQKRASEISSEDDVLETWCRANSSVLKISK